MVFVYLIPVVLVLISWMILRSTSLRFLVTRFCASLKDKFHVYNCFKVPEFKEGGGYEEENQLYVRVSTYLSSLSSIEDSDYANLFSGKKSSISVHLDVNQIVHDTFLGAKVSWKKEFLSEDEKKCFVLKLRKKDKRRILRPYLQHIHSVSDEIEARRRDLKIYTNVMKDLSLVVVQKTTALSRMIWRSAPFAHPASLETVAMDADLKAKVKADLESFLKSKQYYHRLGRVWKRSYLLYGPSGTGKSSFIAAMAKFLNYDIYDIDLSKVSDNCHLKMLLLQTSLRSVIVVEDLDKFLNDKSTAVTLSGVLNFMDGLFSCCGEERVMVFTMNSKDHIDPSIMRPGRIDAQIYFPLCDFTAFKTLASSYLGLKDHKLFPQVEEIFQNGATLSPAEIGEIMIVNRSSPSRAIKSVMTALGAGKSGRRTGELDVSRDRTDVESVEQPSGVLCTESVHTVREFRKLYGLLRLKSGRKQSGNGSDFGDAHTNKIDKDSKDG